MFQKLARALIDLALKNWIYIKLNCLASAIIFKVNESLKIRFYPEARIRDRKDAQGNRRQSDIWIVEEWVGV